MFLLSRGCFSCEPNPTDVRLGRARLGAGEMRGGETGLRDKWRKTYVSRGGYVLSAWTSTLAR